MSKFAVTTAGVATSVPQNAVLVPERLFAVNAACVAAVTSQPTVVFTDKI